MGRRLNTVYVGALLLTLLFTSNVTAQSKSRLRTQSKIEQANQVMQKDPTLSFKLASEALLYSKKSGEELPTYV